jgi:DNA-binding NtrC family response regulator
MINERNTSSNILIVEDDSEIREMLSELAERELFSVFQASSGESALEQAQKVVFDLIITDIAMPGISGIELADKLRCNQFENPIIFVSGKCDLKTLEDSLHLDIFTFYAKPFSKDQFLKSVQIAAEIGKRNNSLQKLHHQSHLDHCERVRAIDFESKFIAGLRHRHFRLKRAS